MPRLLVSFWTVSGRCACHHRSMSWFSKPKPKKAVTSVARHGRGEPHISAETEQRIAHFLLSHGRMEQREGRPLMHVLGRFKNFDDTMDYSVRTHVKLADGKRHAFTTHIREYPSGRMRLIR